MNSKALYNTGNAYGSKTYMNTASKTVLAVIAVAIIGYIASFFVPVPTDWNDSALGFHWTLSSSVLYTLLHVGAAVLFISGVGAYKEALRAAYMKIAIGIVLVGGGLAQVVFLNIFDLIQTPWVQYGGVTLPFVVAGLAIYFGTRSMAALIGVRSFLRNVWFVAPLLVVCVIVVSLLPHKASALPELVFDISNAISAWDVVLYAASLVLVLQMKAHSGAHYANAISWFAVGLVGSVVITLCVLVGTLLSGQAPAGYLLDSIVIIGGLLYLKAGYSFARTKDI
jgi:hypothetical protein